MDTAKHNNMDTAKQNSIQAAIFNQPHPYLRSTTRPLDFRSIEDKAYAPYLKYVHILITLPI